MRIALIASPWIPVPPPNYGGTEFVIGELAKGFNAQGHSVTVFADAQSRLPSGVEVIQPLLRRMRADETQVAYETEWVEQALQRIEGSSEAFDVIHDHTGPGKEHRRPAGIPVVTTFHWIVENWNRNRLRTAGETSALIGISRRQAIIARENGIKISRVIPHGVPVDEFRFGTGQGDAKGRYFFYAGRMTPDKGCDIAARVAQTAGLRLVLAGPIPPKDAKFFESEVRPYCHGSVEYIGEQDRSRVRELMADASAFVFPMRWDEPFGLVFSEALAAGCPIVTTTKGAAPEIVTSATGVLCNSEGDLADAWIRASKLNRNACRQRAERCFSTDRMIADHLNLYASLTREFSASEGLPLMSGQQALPTLPGAQTIAG